jgi:transcription initiation factor IIE alpha subunit
LQEYSCPLCERTYTTLHAAVLIKSDGLFHCEDCDAVLEAGGEQGGGTSRRERTRLVKAKQVTF